MLVLSPAAPASAADWLCRGVSKVKGGEVVVDMRVDPQRGPVGATAGLTLGERNTRPEAMLSVWIELGAGVPGVLARTQSIAVIMIIPAKPPPTAAAVMLMVTVDGRGVSKPWVSYPKLVEEAATAVPPSADFELAGLTGRIPFDEAFTSGDPLKKDVKGPIDIRAVGEDGVVVAEGHVRMPTAQVLRKAVMRSYAIALLAARYPATRCKVMEA